MSEIDDGKLLGAIKFALVNSQRVYKGKTKMIAIVCKGCGDVFTAYRVKRNPRAYCSKQCFCKHYKRSNSKKSNA